MRPNPKEAAAPIGAGVRSLIRGHNPPPAPAIAPIAPARPTAPQAAIPRWYLFAGDVLLVALALTTAYKSPHPLSWPRELFCGALVVLAAILAVIALLMPESQTTTPSPQP